MIKYSILFLMMIIETGILLSQYRHDHTLVLGYWSRNGGIEDPILTFGDEGVRVKYSEHPLGMLLEGLTMSNSAGELQFYTNGCDMANHRHEIMDNGTGFNPGAIADLNCHVGLGITQLPQSIISIPMSENENIYRVFHETVDWLRRGDDAVIRSKLFYSIVDMKANGGMGRVIAKNVSVGVDSFSNNGSMAVVKKQIVQTGGSLNQEYLEMVVIVFTKYQIKTSPR